MVKDETGTTNFVGHIKEFDSRLKIIELLWKFFSCIAGAQRPMLLKNRRGWELALSDNQLHSGHFHAGKAVLAPGISFWCLSHFWVLYCLSPSLMSADYLPWIRFSLPYSRSAIILLGERSCPMSWRQRNPVDRHLLTLLTLHILSDIMLSMRASGSFLVPLWSSFLQKIVLSSF